VLQLNKEEAIAHAAHCVGGPNETFVLNLGPQHPSTHACLRVKLTMDGEFIRHAEPVCGYMHRMHEKMARTATARSSSPIPAASTTLRDAVHPRLGRRRRTRLQIEVPLRAEYIRVITSELNRIASHLVGWGAMVMDLAASPPSSTPSRTARRSSNLLESVSGARLTFCYYRIGGVCPTSTTPSSRAPRPSCPTCASA
jgi:NADH-quinone oxidoreductase subunit D